MRKLLVAAALVSSVFATVTVTAAPAQADSASGTPTTCRPTAATVATWASSGAGGPATAASTRPWGGQRYFWFLYA